MTAQQALNALWSYDHAILSEGEARRLYEPFDLKVEPDFWTAAAMRKYLASRPSGGVCNGEDKELVIGSHELAENILTGLGGELLGLSGVGSRLRFACERIAERLGLTVPQ